MWESLCNRNGSTENMFVEHSHIKSQKKGGKDEADTRLIYQK